MNCKFTGQNLESLSLSHWLCQDRKLENNKKWNEILCPSFIGDHFFCGDFVKVCFELQFITSLIDVAINQKCSPLHYISGITRKGYHKKNLAKNDQINLFNQNSHINSEKYDRIVLNLTDFPKKNPHFYLLGQIQSQLAELKANGFLVVLTNQNLFVPSQSERVNQLLKKVSLTGYINFEELKGRGELASHVYIFTNQSNQHSKFSLHQSFGMNLNDYTSFQSDKHDCLTFRFTGELSTFHFFSKIERTLKSFFKQKSSESTSIYQEEISSSINFEFYQDAIVNGRLINSSSSDPSKITHPNFFKNLMKTCIPLDTFFGIDQLDPKNQHLNKNLSSTDMLLNFLHQDENYPLVLIVDFRHGQGPFIEIINYSAYESKAEEYGHALCTFFGLSPKRKEININLFREYFMRQ